MAETKPTEYHVLRLYHDPTGVEHDDPADAIELWEIVDTRTTTSSDAAKKAYVAENPENAGRTLVTVPTGNWKPQRPKARAVIYDLEDA